MDLYKHIPEETFFPTVWFETKVEVPSAMAGQILLLSKLPIIFAVSGMTLLGLGIGVAVTVCLCCTNKGRSGGGSTLILDNDQNPILNQSLFNEEEQQQDEGESEEGPQQQDGKD